MILHRSRRFTPMDLCRESEGEMPYQKGIFTFLVLTIMLLLHMH